MDDYILNKGILSDEEQRKILYALRSQQIAEKEDVSELLTKLSGVFQKPDTPWISVDFSDWNSTQQDQEVFSILKEAILNHHVLSFFYHDSYGKGKQRTCEPLQLLFKGQAWYLIAYCLEKQAQRSFKLKRMRHLHIKEETFDRALEPLQGHYAQYKQTELELTLLFARTMGYRVFEEFSFDQIEEVPQGYLVHTKLAKGEMLYGILLSYGASLEIIEPIEIRQEFIQKVKEIAKVYTYDK